MFNGTYGDESCSWPRRTVMVYRFTINGTSSGYKVIHNTSSGDHAEIKFIDEVRKSVKEQHTEIKIKMFISYSPCDNCAKAIDRLDRRN